MPQKSTAPAVPKASPYASRAAELIGLAAKGKVIKTEAAALLSQEAKLHQTTTMPAAHFKFLLLAARGVTGGGKPEAESLLRGVK